MADSFSVAMCTYNGVRYLPEQLASIAAQTRPPDELIICDDRSSDGTQRVVESFAASAPFSVRLYVNERTLGSTQNFGKAISLCSGELVALCDQDDVWMPAKLERMEAVFDARPRVGLVFADAELVDENLIPLGWRLWERIGFGRKKRRLVGSGRALDVLLPGWTVTGATMAFRSAFIPLVLDIPCDLAMIHDGWIALSVAAVADVSFIDEPLIKYRQHPRQQIGAPDKRLATGEQHRGEFRAALVRANTYADLIRIAESVRLRLIERGERFYYADSLVRLDAWLKHLRAREGMPASRLERMPLVLRELFSRRYHLYSKGVKSAIKDLLT